MDRYGHLLDALDDEVMAAVEWAMDPTAPLPGFLLHSGLATAVPHQRSAVASDPWTDMDEGEELRGTVGPVFVLTLAGREIPFADRRHAQDVADQWDGDRAGKIAELRARGWTEELTNRIRAAGPEVRERWTGGGQVWTRMPDRQFVHHQVASFSPDGSLSYEPQPLASRWAWEFETDLYSHKAAQMRTEFRPGPAATTEAYARGTNKAAVQLAFESACEKARDVCGQSPYLDLVNSVGS
ncbi:hypothetical protein [Streptomyces sp. NPDC088400]|uniref:hypothetical protein n=1 Tax=Streptomyces sp. NPDC088400 TaxID=3365861 RepID=UPI0037F2B810